MNTKVTTLDDAPTPATTKKIDAAASAQSAQKLEAAKQSGSGEFSGDRSIVTISQEPGEGGRNAVFVGVAGVGFLIPRGIPCDVPVEVANTLSDAIVTSYEPDESTGKTRRVDSPRYGFIRQDKPAATVAA